MNIGRCLDEEENADQEEETSKWYQFYRPYTREEKKRMVAKVVQLSLEQCFRNHIYHARNILYRQMSGEGNGARVKGGCRNLSHYYIP